MEKEITHYPPLEENLGKNCQYWDKEECTCAYVLSSRAGFSQVAGRIACEGMIDDICLLRVQGRVALRLTMAENAELLARPATYLDNRKLPPGETK